MGEGPAGLDGDAKAAVSCLLLQGNALQKEKDVGKKRKKKSFQVAAQIWSGVCRGREKEGWSEMSPKKGARGKGEEGERARERAEAASRGLAACDVVFPRSFPSLSAFSLLLFSSCSVAPNLTSLPQPSD